MKTLILTVAIMLGLVWLIVLAFLALRDLQVFQKSIIVIKKAFIWIWEEIKKGWKDSLMVGEKLLIKPDFSIVSFRKSVREVFSKNASRVSIRNIVGRLFSFGVWVILYLTFKAMILKKRLCSK